LKVEWRISHNFGDLDIHLHRVHEAGGLPGSR